jgi:hypothetical protein
MIDKPMDRKIIDSQRIFKIKPLVNRAVDKFKACLVTQAIPKYRDRIKITSLPL